MLQNDIMSRKPILGVYFIICVMVFIFERFFFKYPKVPQPMAF